MKMFFKKILCMISVFFVFLPTISWKASAKLSPVIYYISSSSGDDSNAGTSTSAAWKSFANVAKQPLHAGDKILLRRGDIWHERLTFYGNGSENAWIYVGPYGDIKQPRPEIKLSGDADDICIVAQDLISQTPFNNGLSYIHIDNLTLSNSRLGIYFRSAVSYNHKGFQVTDCEFNDMVNAKILQDATASNEAIAQELNKPKGKLDTYSALGYSETGGGAGEYFWPAAIMVGGRRSQYADTSFSELTFERNKFNNCINGVVTIFYNTPLGKNYPFKNLKIKDCEITGTINGIWAAQGVDAGYDATATSKWGIFKNVSVISGHPSLTFRLGTTGLIVESTRNLLYTDSWFNGVRNNGYSDGCGFDFEAYTQNITLQNCIFSNNQGQAILMMENQPNKPHTNITIQNNLFYNNMQNVNNDEYRWDLTIWNKGNTNVRLINNRHISKKRTQGGANVVINSDDGGFLGIGEKPRSFGKVTEGITETNATFVREDNLPDFNKEVQTKGLTNSLKRVVIIEKAYSNNYFNNSAGSINSKFNNQSSSPNKTNENAIDETATNPKPTETTSDLYHDKNASINQSVNPDYLTNSDAANSSIGQNPHSQENHRKGINGNIIIAGAIIILLFGGLLTYFVIRKIRKNQGKNTNPTM